MGACSPKKSENAPTQTPYKNLPQLYFIWDATRQSVDSFKRPRPQQIQSGFGARVEEVSVGTLAEAVETLQQWNGRPIDILFLGEGLPSEAFLRLTLSKHAARRYVFWDGPPLPALVLKEHLQLRLDWESVRALVKNLCVAKFSFGQGCKIYPQTLSKKWKEIPEGPTSIYFGNEPAPDGASAEHQLRLSIKWDQLLGELFKKRLTGQFNIDFKSALMEWPPSSESKESDKLKYQEIFKAWALQSL